ncbi:(d)CMP kinase [Membranicola marinus]|uniref:Cytidylate kinase n=1 Tax=Membranihabitans marinus TaxID=1227546 RepID=A0A953HWU1_9BACT|nr:(d)CMP kinase [Membranihabitans marinus]MBY5959238.1 (d)CMP kinase [Membranihabitans marinus]
MPCHQISIDGYAACGKSTLARELADELNFIYIDSGAMYRGVTLYFLREGVSFDTEPPDALVQSIDIRFEYVPGAADKLYLNGEDVSTKLRTSQVNENVSKVAALPNVRRRLVALQQDYGHTHNVVMDGRDIGTVVFPGAVLKIFLTANLETRVRRRMNDIKSSNQYLNVDEIRTNLLTRDHIDSTRADSPLKQSEDSVVIDNTNLTRKEQLVMVRSLAALRIQESSCKE